jgi:hypothetical protein
MFRTSREREAGNVWTKKSLLIGVCGYPMDVWWLLSTFGRDLEIPAKQVYQSPVVT